MSHPTASAWSTSSAALAPSTAVEHTLAVVTARAWADPAFLARLVADPRAVLAENGHHLDPGVEVEVLVDRPGLTHLAVTRHTTDVESVTRLLAGRLPLAEGTELRVVQSTDTHRHLVLPLRPEGLTAQVTAEVQLLGVRADDSSYTNTETVTNTVTVTDVGVTTTAVAQAEVGAEIVAVVVAVLT